MARGALDSLKRGSVGITKDELLLDLQLSKLKETLKWEGAM